MTPRRVVLSREGPAPLATLAVLVALVSLDARAIAAGPPKDRHHYTMVMIDAGEMTAEEAAKLEAKIQQQPDDLLARVRLLGYYQQKAMDAPFRSKERRELTAKKAEHAIWLVENKPESGVCGDLDLDPHMDPDAFARVSELWQKHLGEHPDKPEYLWNAAEFHLIYDMERAEQYLLRGKELEPNEPDWPRQLAHLYELQERSAARSAGRRGGGPPMSGMSADAMAEMRARQEAMRKEMAVKRLAQTEDALAQATAPQERYMMLGGAAGAAFEAGEHDKAQKYAEELLKLAATMQTGWNEGNAIFEGNTVLGRLALARGDVEKACDHLIVAGMTPGSPQLNSFGPSMVLAKELLAAGKRDAVIQYLELCKKFWELHDGALDRWIATIRGGGEPDERDGKWGR